MLKAFLKCRKPGLFVNFGQFPCSWIRIRIPNPYPGQPINADSDPQVVDHNTSLLLVIAVLAHTDIIFAIHHGSTVILNIFRLSPLEFFKNNSKLLSSILNISIRYGPYSTSLQSFSR
jgi:hypothetical protein